MNHDKLPEPNKDKLYEIYANDIDTDTFWVGYIVGKDEEFLLIQCLDFYGNYDGITCLPNETVFSLREDTVYLKSIEKLAKIRCTSVENVYPEKDLMNSIVEQIHRNKRICTLRLCGDDFEIDGYISSVDDETLTMSLVDDKGNNDGTCVVELDRVSLVNFDSADTIRLELLHS